MILEGLAAAAAAAYGYGSLVEAYRLHLVETELTLDRLPAEFDGFTILQLSDLHLKEQSWYERRQLPRLERGVIELISGREFDMCAITGDVELRGAGWEAMPRILAAVRCNHGPFFVPGNAEYQHYDMDKLLATLDSWGVTTLRNSSCSIERGGARIQLVGVDDPFTKHADLAVALRDVPQDSFKLLLAHSPSIARDAVRSQVDLMLSGHTHGGQVCAPYFGALYTHLGKGSPHFSQGVYEGRRLSARTGMDAGATKLYITRGIGMSGLYVRFFCPPEVTVITLRSASKGRLR
jgi:uncharacterized protein